MVLEVYTLVEKNTFTHYSPFVWRTIILLEYKKVAYKIIPLTLKQVIPTIKALTYGAYDRVPLVKFEDGTLVGESGKLSEIIDSKYPSPTIFQSGRQISKFMETYFMYSLTHLFKHTIPTTIDKLSEEDKSYYLESRKVWFGCDCYTFVGDQDTNLKLAERDLAPIRVALTEASFFDGEAFGYNDIILCAMFKWIETCDQEGFKTYLAENSDQTLKVWYTRCDALLSGLLSKPNDYRTFGQS